MLFWATAAGAAQQSFGVGGKISDSDLSKISDST